MSKKNRDYWRQRYSILKNNLLNRSDDYKIRLQEQYDKAQKEIEERINIFYQRFATNNNITFNEATKILNSNERKKFQMTLNEYIEKGKDNAVSNQWIKELENASDIYHISRLKALQIEIRQQIELLTSSKEKGMTDLFSGIYEDSYYGGIYEIQKGFNYGKPFAQLDTRKINAALIRPYDSTGLSFSEKIWNDRKALAQYLDTDFARSIMRGANPQTLSEELAKKFKTSIKNANRLLITESANIASFGSQACFNELGVEEFENLESLDGKTCEVCQDMDKTHFPMKDFQIGLNAAPFHPNCRGVQVPYFNDEFTANEQRFARDENGKGYYVPADMSYKEWKKEHINKPSNLEKYNKNKKNKLSQKSRDDIIKLNSKSFKPANTIQEAEDFARNELNILRASYKGLDIFVANEWNKGLQYYHEKFPEVMKRIKFVGEIHERNDILRDLLRQDYKEKIKTKFPKLAKEVNILEREAEKELIRITEKDKKISIAMQISDEYAQSWFQGKDIFSDVNGVTVNKYWGKNFAEFIQVLSEDVELKFHPIGCDNIAYVLDHEMGHQLDKLLDISYMPVVQDLFNGRTKDQLTDDLCQYSWDNTNSNRYGEMIAEAWAEYKNNDNPRDLASIIGHIIESEYKKKFG